MSQPTSISFRALCAELADRLDDALTYTVQSDTERSMRQLIARTRAELAQPEPEFTAEEVEMIQAPWSYLAPAQPEQPVSEHRPVWTEGICGDGAAILKDGVMQPIEDVLAALNAPSLAQPEPEGPSPVDYRRWHEARSEDCSTWSEQPTAPLTLRTTVEALAWANYCLARYARPAIKPAPVAERFEFSVFNSEYEEQAGGAAPTYAQALSEGQHYLSEYSQDGPHSLEIRRVEVLPHFALPVPTSEEATDA